MSKIKSQGRVQIRAAMAAETLADTRARTNVNWVALRAENARRTLAASNKPTSDGPDRTWLARDVFSTPFATVIAS